MSFNKPKVTIDLDEYNHLLEAEKKSKSIVDGISEQELSNVVCMLTEGSARNAGLQSVIEHIRTKLNIEVIYSYEEPRLKFKKLK